MQILKTVKSKNDNEIQLIEYSSGVPNEKKTVLVIGAVHGDEPQGKYFIENYLKSCKKTKNRMLFIPCLNPDGIDLKTRQNSNEIDINRNFPTENWVMEPFASEYFGGESPSSEIETRFVIDVMTMVSPDIILTLHSPYKVVNYDGPAKDIAQKVSDIIGYPVKSDIGYATPGSFGTYAGVERNIPTLTLEFDEDTNISELVSPMNDIFNMLGEY